MSEDEPRLSKDDDDVEAHGRLQDADEPRLSARPQESEDDEAPDVEAHARPQGPRLSEPRIS
jgi:hypothetical protein